MNKKLIAVLALTAVLMCACFGIAACHEHTLTLVEAADATCEQNGNAAYYKCTGCDKLFADEDASKQISSDSVVIDALGHNYVDGVCTRCNAKQSQNNSDSADDTFWQNFADSLLQTSYGVKIENFSVTYDSDCITMDIAELLLGVDDEGNLIGSGYGTMKNNSTVGASEEYSAKYYIADNNLYFVENAEETYYICLPADSLLELISGDATVATGLDWAKDNLVPIAENVYNTNKDEIAAYFERVYSLGYTKVENSDGTYTFTLDLDSVKTVNEDLYKLKLNELVDKYCGEGSYAQLSAFLKRITTIKVSDVLTWLESCGVTTEKLYAAANELGTLITGEEFSVENYLTESVLNSTLGQLAATIYEQASGTAFASDEERSDFILQAQATINAVLEYAPTMTGYDMIAEIAGMIVSDSSSATVPTAEELYNEVDVIIDKMLAKFKDTYTVSVNTSASGAITSIVTEYNNFEYDYSSSEVATISMKITIVPGATSISVDVSGIVEDYENAYPELEANKTYTCTYNYYDDFGEIEEAVTYNILTNADGKITQVTICYSDGTEETLTKLEDSLQVIGQMNDWTYMMVDNLRLYVRVVDGEVEFSDYLPSD